MPSEGVCVHGVRASSEELKAALKWAAALYPDTDLVDHGLYCWIVAYRDAHPPEEKKAKKSEK